MPAKEFNYQVDDPVIVNGCEGVVTTVIDGQVEVLFYKEGRTESYDCDELFHMLDQQHALDDLGIPEW